MRDFTNGGDINVGGDFNLTDASENDHKLLQQCTSQELFAERPFRQENIRIEQRKKVKQLQPFYALTVILSVAAASWAYYNGMRDMGSVLMGAGALFLGYQSLKATVEPNAFQLNEQRAVDECSLLLKQRRAE